MVMTMPIKMGLYKMDHKNHPSTIWVRSSEDNYDWLWRHMCGLMKEYTYRYSKHHDYRKTKHGVVNVMSNCVGDGEFTNPPQCMPDYCKGEDTVLAYQNYYILEKSDLQSGLNEERQCFFVEKYDARETVLGLHGAQAREDAQVMHNSLHLKLDDHEKQKIFTEVDILKKEVSQLQESLQNSYVKIKELKSPS